MRKYHRNAKSTEKHVGGGVKGDVTTGINAGLSTTLETQGPVEALRGKVESKYIQLIPRTYQVLKDPQGREKETRTAIPGEGARS